MAHLKLRTCPWRTIVVSDTFGASSELSDNSPVPVVAALMDLSLSNGRLV